MPIRDAPVFREAAVYLSSCPLNLGNKPGSIIVDSQGDERTICVVNRIMQSGEKERKGMIVVEFASGLKNGICENGLCELLCRIAPCGE